MKQLPDKFSVYAKTLKEAKYITEKQKELCGDSSPKHKNVYYRFSIYREIDKFGFSSQSYLTYNRFYDITQEFTFEEFKSYFEEQNNIKDMELISIKKLKLDQEYVVYLETKEEWEILNKLVNGKGLCLFCKGECHSLYDGTHSHSSSKTNPGSYRYKDKPSKIITIYQIKEYQDMENKEIIGYKLVKPEYETYFNKLTGTSNIDRIKDSVGKLTWVDEAIKTCKKAGVLDLWFEPVMAETERTLTLSNGKSVKITKEGVEAEGKLIKIKYIENLFCNTYTFGATEWTIQYNSFDIGCYKNLKREDLSKIIETYNLIK